MNQNRNSFLFAFILVTSLFFLWAFLHNTNGVLIPHLRKACQLNDTQSSLIDFAVYLGYFLMAIPAGLVMHKYGYKRGIILGLIFFGLGALLFVPAASERSFVFFLSALFIQAAGATFLETVANPYVTILGPKETSEQRLNFAQSFNGVGAVVAPIIGGAFIFSGIEHTNEELNQMALNGTLNTYLQSEADTVKLPYIIIASVVAVVTICFLLTKLPEVKESDAADAHTGFSLKVLRHSHVKWAVIAQFFYVGAQVGVNSFFVKFSKQVIGLPEKTAAIWLSSAAAGFMVGRFAGTFLMKYIKPQRLLVLYALINILLLVIALATSGKAAVYAVVAVPFFMSIMFPTIFALGIKELGEETKMASSLIVMSIVGGALAPIIMGAISDATGSMQKAYIVPLSCFIVVAWFGWKGYKIKQANV